MADFDIEQLKEQTEAAEKLNEIYKKLTDGQISFKQALQERLTQEATLEDSLRKQLGAQTDLLRAGELKQEILNDVLARDWGRGGFYKSPGALYMLCLFFWLGSPSPPWTVRIGGVLNRHHIRPF